MLIDKVKCVEVAREHRILICDVAGVARIVRVDEKPCVIEMGVSELATAAARVSMDAVLLALAEDPVNVARLARLAARLASSRGNEKLAALLVHVARRVEAVAKGGDLSEEEARTLEELRGKKRRDKLAELLESMRTTS